MTEAKLYCGSVFRDTFNPEEPQIVILLPKRLSSVITVASIIKQDGKEMIHLGDRELDIQSYIHSTDGSRWSLDKMINATRAGFEISGFGEKMKLEFMKRAVSRLEENYNTPPILVTLRVPSKSVS